MPFSFRRVDPRREQLEELRRQISDLQNELAILENTTGEDSPEMSDATPASGEADIYQSVSRLRVTMVRREVRTKRQQLDELIQKETALAQTLRLPPPRPAPRPAAGTSAPSTPNGKGAAPAPVRPATTAQPTGVSATAGSSVSNGRSGRRQRGAKPRRDLKLRMASLNLFNLSLAIAAIVVVFALGLVLSGLLEVDPNKPYGFLSTVARIAQGATIGWMRPGY